MADFALQESADFRAGEACGRFAVDGDDFVPGFDAAFARRTVRNDANDAGRVVRFQLDADADEPPVDHRENVLDLHRGQVRRIRVERTNGGAKELGNRRGFADAGLLAESLGQPKDGAFQVGVRFEPPTLRRVANFRQQRFGALAPLERETVLFVKRFVRERFDEPGEPEREERRGRRTVDVIIVDVERRFVENGENVVEARAVGQLDERRVLVTQFEFATSARGRETISERFVVREGAEPLFEPFFRVEPTPGVEERVSFGEGAFSFAFVAQRESAAFRFRFGVERSFAVEEIVDRTKGRRRRKRVGRRFVKRRIPRPARRRNRRGRLRSERRER